MIASLWIFLSFFACKSDVLSEDGWWQNESADPYPPNSSTNEGEFGEGEFGEGEFDDGGEEVSEFWGFLFQGEEGYTGESGLYTPTCEWYSTLSGFEIDACPECSFALNVSFGEMEAINTEDCSGAYAPSEWADIQLPIGFGEEQAWIYREEWLPLGYSFEEGGGFGWYVEME